MSKIVQVFGPKGKISQVSAHNVKQFLVRNPDFSLTPPEKPKKTAPPKAPKTDASSTPPAKPEQGKKEPSRKGKDGGSGSDD